MSTQVTVQVDSVAVTTDAIADGNVIITPNSNSVQVSPNIEVIDVSVTVTPTQAVTLSATNQVILTTVGLVGIQGPPGQDGVGGGGGVEFPSPTLTDTAGVVYYYYGWTEYPNSGDGWLIRRVDYGETPNRVIATEDNNPTYLDLATAWTDRTTLNYVPG